MTHFEVIVSALSGTIGLLGTLIVVIWRARGYIDRLNTTDSELAIAITELGKTMMIMHRQNQARFSRIERKIRR
jgi:hypothetical protein